MQRRRISLPSKITLISCAVALAVLVLVWVGTSMVPDHRPETLADAKSEVLDVFDRVEGTIPPTLIVGTSESTDAKTCATGDGTQQARIRRVIDIDPNLDRVRWTADLKNEFVPEDGWNVRTYPLDSRENLGVKLVGTQLLIFRITASDASGQVRVTITSTSRCARPE